MSNASQENHQDDKATNATTTAPQDTTMAATRENDALRNNNKKEDDNEHEFYMRQALQVAREALAVGEVPVGCVIVLHTDDDNTVVVSHGANQVNATRDATRHAEIVAIDRMLTQGASSDQLRLPPAMVRKAAHGIADAKDNDDDKLINEPSYPGHWKNTYGWGSGRTFTPDVFAKCDLYVTCEPCIMCAAALARVGIRRVYFGCHNDRFGGCGSILSLHEEKTFESKQHIGYPVQSGILKEEAISLLQSFYNRENYHAPEDKRKRKST